MKSSAMAKLVCGLAAAVISSSYRPRKSAGLCVRGPLPRSGPMRDPPAAARHEAARRRAGAARISSSRAP